MFHTLETSHHFSASTSWSNQSHLWFIQLHFCLYVQSAITLWCFYSDIHFFCFCFFTCWLQSCISVASTNPLYIWYFLLLFIISNNTTLYETCIVRRCKKKSNLKVLHLCFCAVLDKRYIRCTESFFFVRK